LRKQTVMTLSESSNLDLPVRVARNAAEAVFHTLRAWRIDRVYICPGSTEAGFLDASLDFPDIELILTLHEAVSIAMADGYSRATGKPSVVYVHTHLGLGNAISHLYCAHLENSPVVVLAGVKARGLQGGDGFTTTHDIRSIPRQFVKWDWQSLTREGVASDLDRALRISTAVPSGPTFVAFPQDLLETTFKLPTELDFEPSSIGASRADPGLLDEVAARLQTAERPIIVVGGDAAWPEVSRSVEALADHAGAVIVFEDKRTISRASMLRNVEGYAGLIDGSGIDVQSADLLLFAGAGAPLRFEERSDGLFAVASRIYLVNDASEITSGAAGALGVVGDVSKSLDDLANRFHELSKVNRSQVPGRGASSKRFRDSTCVQYRSSLKRDDDLLRSEFKSSPVRVPLFMRALVEALPIGAVVVDDSVTSKASVLNSVLSPGSGLMYLTTAGGSLGWGMAAALGVAQGLPDRPVFAIVGDGVFHFGVQSLFTAVREHLSVTYFVINNQRYAAVTAALRRYDGNAVARGVVPGADISGPDIVAISRGYGARVFRVESLSDLRDVLEEAALVPGPVVVDVRVDTRDCGPTS
jgi:benzoylformate decarboxylase